MNSYSIPGGAPANHSPVCPALINERRKTAIAIGALESIGTAEARQALRSIAVLDGLKEPVLCLHDDDGGGE